jgi:membrane-bound lytic murein transglycosylase MltF
MPTNYYDDLIKQSTKNWFPELFDIYGEHGWLLIKAQMWQESRFDPEAVSPAGAVGLMQIMPATAKDNGIDVHNIQDNVEFGVAYLGEQYDKLHELYGSDRISAALASYNGGRGYINRAMALGRDMCGQPESYGTWDKLGRPRGAWQTWPVLSRLLEHPDCVKHGKRPDYGQMQTYVSSIWHYFSVLVVGK